VYLFGSRVAPSSKFRFGAVLRTFCLTCFAWIFFRANSVQDAIYIAGHLFEGLTSVPRQLHQVGFLKGRRTDGGTTSKSLFSPLAGIAILFGVHILQNTVELDEVFSRQSVVVRWGAYYAALTLILFFGAFNQSQQFIYFQF